MASRTVDVVATGPPSADPYDPAAPAWGLAAGFAARGDDVAVLRPEGPPGSGAPPGVHDVPVALALRRPGAAIEAAELAVAAGRRFRPHVEIILRDPVGLGRVGRGRGGDARLGAFVRGIELVDYEKGRAARAPGGWRDRLDDWRDRRSVRRLEEAALREADRLFFDTPAVRAALRETYGLPEGPFRPMLPAVTALPDGPGRDDARATFRIPTDVPVVVAPASAEDPGTAGIDRAREAFKRVRSFFPGARLIVTGTDGPAEPGVVVASERDGGTLGRALAAADVGLFLRRDPGFDPGAVLALRAGLAVILGPSVRLPTDPGDAVRRAATDDPGDAASLLAELLADPSVRRPLAQGARTYAEPFDPSRVAERVTVELARS